MTAVARQLLNDGVTPPGETAMEENKLSTLGLLTHPTMLALYQAHPNRLDYLDYNSRQKVFEAQSARLPAQQATAPRYRMNVMGHDDAVRAFLPRRLITSARKRRRSA